ncbi:MAG: hypothetical protein GY822_12400, partial [Deltaproteobacteria bacterium]|nr:hypothetical protein [Deltaproteobacteria bacterium]
MLLFSQSEQEQTGVSMGILRPIITSIIKPIITNIVSVASSISRYFQVYNGTSSFGEFATPEIFTGDFTVSIDFATTETATGTLVCGSSPYTFFIHIKTSSVKVYIGDGASWNIIMAASTTNVTDGIFHTVVVDKSGNDYTVTLNEAVIDSANSAAVVTPNIMYTGRRSGGSGALNYFNGTEANL